MKKHVVSRILILLSLLLLFALQTGCFRLEMVPYYHDQSNYQSYTGVVTKIRYHQMNGAIALYLDIEEQEPKLADYTFALEAENLTIAQENGIDSLQVGTNVEFVSAPRYYGDGYIMPLVGLKAGNTIYLDREQGIANWIALLDKRYK